jgi:hypothetical protein
MRYRILQAAFAVGFGDISVAKTFIHVDDRPFKQARLY